MSKKKVMLNIIVYTLLLIFFCFWNIKDHLPSYFWIVSIILLIIIVFKFKELLK